MSPHKAATQLLQCLVKPKDVPGFWEAGLGKYIMLAPGAVAKDDWNGLFKCHSSLSVARLLLWTSGMNALNEQSYCRPVHNPCGSLDQDYNQHKAVCRACGRTKSFSAGEEPAITLKIYWVHDNHDPSHSSQISLED